VQDIRYNNYFNSKMKLIHLKLSLKINQSKSKLKYCQIQEIQKYQNSSIIFNRRHMNHFNNIVITKKNLELQVRN